MEKAMYQSHGVSYEEYGRKLDRRLEIEKRRELDYKQSRLILNEVERKMNL